MGKIGLKMKIFCPQCFFLFEKLNRNLVVLTLCHLNKTSLILLPKDSGNTLSWP